MCVCVGVCKCVFTCVDTPARTSVVGGRGPARRPLCLAEDIKEYNGVHTNVMETKCGQDAGDGVRAD